MNQPNNSHLYYLENEQYTRFLDSQTPESFYKYVEVISKHMEPHKKLLDVGCGTGIVLQQLKMMGFARGVGVEISRSSLRSCKNKGLECYEYDGFKLPFEDGSFDLVGSINVIEHTQDPIVFMNEKHRVLKPSGILVVVCPNFLSVTNNYHQNTRGYMNKLRNMFSIVRKLRSTYPVFDKMEVTIRHEFQPDDDAVNVTNHIDILKWSESRGLRTLYASAFQKKNGFFLSCIDRTIFRIFFGSCFYVFQKT